MVLNLDQIKQCLRTCEMQESRCLIPLNEIFRELQMDSTFLDWRDNLPSTMNYLETVNWFEKLRTSGIDNPATILQRRL